MNSCGRLLLIAVAWTVIGGLTYIASLFSEMPILFIGWNFYLMVVVAPAALTWVAVLRECIKKSRERKGH